MNVAAAAGTAHIAEVAKAHEGRVAREGRDGYLIGLVGRGIGRSRSPRMHEQEGARLGAICTYGLLDFDRLGVADAALGAVIAAAEARGFAGLNVTHPFKVTVMPHLTDLAPEAEAIGAVNTIVFRDGRRIGHNTDGWGFAESLRRGLPGAPLVQVLLVGAGGAGAAVGYALLEGGATLLDVFDTDDARSRGLADRLTRRFGRTIVPVSDLAAAIRRASGVVNATPVGMDKYPGVPFDPALLTPAQWVADIVYFPSDTALLQRARAAGCRTLTGTGMAVLQAVKAFEHFTGLVPDPDAMARHFDAAA